MSLLHWSVISWLGLISQVECGFLLLVLECDVSYLFRLLNCFQSLDFEK